MGECRIESKICHNLYRFCFLMLGDSRKAQEVFNTTLREAAVRAAQGELPKEPFWLFRECAGVVWKQAKTDLQPESLEIDEHDIAPRAASQIKQLEPAQLAIWISAAPDPQADRAGALLSRRIRLPRDSRHRRAQAERRCHGCLAQGRRQLQAWLDAKHPEQRKV